ncbi:MAG TPA: universal stress protein [Anaeromyxobacteraceae bacterium]|nr:universal stress protein [Anaeromyxobacteraceae bacterium]
MSAIEWKKILCPVDFSPASRDAVSAAAELARRFAGEVTLFHAYPLPGYTLPEGTVLPSPRMLQDLADQTDRLLEEWRKLAVGMGAPSARCEKAIGDPAAEVLERAKTGGYDLLVVGTRGRTGLAHALLGSVAERVVRRSPIPVLTVHPRA